jgi:LytS/YehU family sensor histidine kinase
MEWIDQRFSIQELELEKSKVENRYLRNQLNPHFLFNTMNNLHGLILTDTKLASESVLRFSDFLQYMVYESAEDFIPLEKEIQLVKDYVALERLRADKKKEIEIDIQITDPNYKIAPLLLLPLIENAIKHGLNVVEQGAFMKVQIKQQQLFLNVCVTNSKRSNAPKDGEGIGLANLKRRLELQYKNAHELHLREDAEVFKMELKLQLHAL